MMLVGEHQTPETPLTAPPSNGRFGPTIQTFMEPPAAMPTTPVPGGDLRVWKTATIATFNALAMVLAARFVVLVAVIGGVVLTYMALDHPDPYRLGALAIYSVFIVGPTIVLAGLR